MVSDSNLIKLNSLLRLTQSNSNPVDIPNLRYPISSNSYIKYPLQSNSVHSCYVDTRKDKIECWGGNLNKESEVPKNLENIGIIASSLGKINTVIVDKAGDMHCFGANESGQCDIPY